MPPPIGGVLLTAGAAFVFIRTHPRVKGNALSCHSPSARRSHNSSISSTVSPSRSVKPSARSGSRRADATPSTPASTAGRPGSFAVRVGRNSLARSLRFHKAPGLAALFAPFRDCFGGLASRLGGQLIALPWWAQKPSRTTVSATGRGEYNTARLRADFSRRSMRSSRTGSRSLGVNAVETFILASQNHSEILIELCVRTQTPTCWCWQLRSKERRATILSRRLKKMGMKPLAATTVPPNLPIGGAGHH